MFPKTNKIKPFAKTYLLVRVKYLLIFNFSSVKKLVGDNKELTSDAQAKNCETHSLFLSKRCATLQTGDEELAFAPRANEPTTGFLRASIITKMRTLSERTRLFFCAAGESTTLNNSLVEMALRQGLFS